MLFSSLVSSFVSSYPVTTILSPKISISRSSAPLNICKASLFLMSITGFSPDLIFLFETLFPFSLVGTIISLLFFGSTTYLNDDPGLNSLILSTMSCMYRPRSLFFAGLFFSNIPLKMFVLTLVSFNISIKMFFTALCFCNISMCNPL
ncbi:hypothetical protein B4088_6391 [Bacillus cereus]|uniref:Uncharacterized protein n=1 Tax=Bacillus cereus TaxID=1396 RepID=A0A164KFT8_BACCE|nr:hypothetical protein B4088_6391 [Bacillus cereus]